LASGVFTVQLLRGTNVKVHVTLVNPPYPSGSSEGTFIPLGIGYLAAVLENNGYAVDVIDCQAIKYTSKQLETEFIQRRPDVIGVTSATLTYKPALEIVKTAKEACPNCLTVMGGPHVTVMDEQTLNEQPEVDIVVRGEGEQTILELADLASKSDLENLHRVDGITLRNNGQIVRTRDRAFIQNLDELPHPAYGHFPLSKYRFMGKNYLPIITSRGCPFQCTFCLAFRMCGRGFRTRSPKKVVDELEWLRDVHGADTFAFYDDTFTFDMKRASEICEEMKTRKIGLTWDCRTRVDRISREILTKMREADCKLIHYGVESGNQKMLNAMKKGTTVEQNEKAIKLTKEIGISVAISVVVGYPGETEDMLKQTFNFIRRTKPDYVYVCQAIPYPGTELYDVLKELGWEMSTEWNHYDEQTQVFRNPLLPVDEIERAKRTFYDHFFSPSYFLHKSLKRDFYSQVMARTALNHLLWRVRLPMWVSSSLKKMRPQQKNQRNA
jgi:anaerobic magnesium-protoporphyrin IX monomethyl ester cyclase